MLGVGVVSPGSRTGVEVHTALPGYSRWKWRVARAPVGKGEKREREKERQEEGEGERRARSTGGGGVIYRLDPRSTVSFSPVPAAPTPRAPQTLAAVRDRDHLSRGGSLREGEEIRLVSDSRFRPHRERDSR